MPCAAPGYRLRAASIRRTRRCGFGSGGRIHACRFRRACSRSRSAMTTPIMNRELCTSLLPLPPMASRRSTKRYATHSACQYPIPSPRGRVTICEVRAWTPPMTSGPLTYSRRCGRPRACDCLALSDRQAPRERYLARDTAGGRRKPTAPFAKDPGRLSPSWVIQAPPLQRGGSLPIHRVHKIAE